MALRFRAFAMTLDTIRQKGLSMSKHQYKIDEKNCTQLSHQATVWMSCFLRLGGSQIFFIGGGGYGCSL
ncbi:hypothetical protein AT248_07875 [Bartonella henselae]|nr:hypothetical protein BhenCHDE101_04440 [Bartonella henselae]PNM38526.1 hypothetical protein AL470_003705 [Bartonella henselae str. Houston-1]OLL38194.1 hypothetical protein AT237_07945 [Bartonella henselae]OLL39013.1 hypothetical protein AT244_01655 [Bartonella henselae]OLL46584.1 hypothetical protein AT245_06190 [Bartonella henselae]